MSSRQRTPRSRRSERVETRGVLCDRISAAVQRPPHRLPAHRCQSRTEVGVGAPLGRQDRPRGVQRTHRRVTPRAPHRAARFGRRGDRRFLPVRHGARDDDDARVGSGLGRRRRPIRRPDQPGQGKDRPRGLGDDQVVRRQLPLRRPRDQRASHELRGLAVARAAR